MKIIPFLVITFVIAFLGGLLGFSPFYSALVGMLVALPIASIMHNLSGNKKTAVADAATQSAAKSMAPSEGKSAIYVVRKGFVGGVQGMDVKIDGIGSTQIKSGLCAYAEVDAGHHNIIAKPAKNAKEETKIQVTTHGNDTAVIKASLAMGAVNNRAELKIVEDAAEARSLVDGAKIVTFER